MALAEQEIPQEELLMDEEADIGFIEIEELQKQGIGAADIAKLKSAGIGGLRRRGLSFLRAEF
jgi:hypothetical protein